MPSSVSGAIPTSGATLIAEGFYFGVDTARLKEAFNPQYPYSYCRICGWVYQPASQRKSVPINLQIPNAPHDSIKKQLQRKQACERHSAQHTHAEHTATQNGKFTPEATYRLAAFGIANPTEIALSKAADKAHEQAGLEAPIPGFWLPDTEPTKVHK